MEHLTTEKAIEICKSGKLIRWEAPIYEGNEGFYGQGKAGGIAKVHNVLKSLTCEKPEHFLKAGIIQGDDINCAKAGGKHVPSREEGLFHFSDSDRFVMFEIVEGQ